MVIRKLGMRRLITLMYQRYWTVWNNKRTWTIFSFMIRHWAQSVCEAQQLLALSILRWATTLANNTNHEIPGRMVYDPPWLQRRFFSVPKLFTITVSAGQLDNSDTAVLPLFTRSTLQNCWLNTDGAVNKWIKWWYGKCTVARVRKLLTHLISSMLPSISVRKR